jgi:pimeloyl-ACP methyl ester carboxylesterase
MYGWLYRTRSALSSHLHSPKQGDFPMSKWIEQHRAVLAMSHADLMAMGQADNPTWTPDIFDHWPTAKHQARMEVFNIFKTPPLDFRSIVANFGVPVLIITGDNASEVVVSAAVAAELQALSIVYVPGAGHCIRYEQPDRVAEIVKEFLGDRFGV